MKHCGNVPVFVTDYPEELKPFYARLNEDIKTVSYECYEKKKKLQSKLFALLSQNLFKLVRFM